MRYLLAFCKPKYLYWSFPIYIYNALILMDLLGTNVFLSSLYYLLSVPLLPLKNILWISYSFLPI